MKHLAGIFIAVFLLAMMGGCLEDDGGGSSDYTITHPIGMKSTDFWTVYPSQHPNSGQSVSHLQWIVDSLESKPVLFVVHRTGCAGCADQAERVIELAEKYEEELIFYDLDAVYGAPQDLLQKANAVYMYDPNGPPGYIALTGLFTYVKEDGEVTIGWHTWEAPNDMTVSDSALETWITDAIHYHDLHA